MGVILDHIGIVGPALEGLEAAFRRLGFTVAPRCQLLAYDEHGNPNSLGQVNSHLVFEDDYVELTAVEGDLSTHHLREAISRYWGLHILVLRTSNAQSEYERLRKSGVDVHVPAMAGRDINYPSGTGTARFRWFRIPDEDVPEAFLCYAEHLDSELVFDKALNDHANGANSLHSVSLLVDGAEACANRIAGLVGVNAVKSEGIWQTPFEGSHLSFLDQEDFHSFYPGEDIPPVPSACVFTVRSKDMELSRRALLKAGVSFRSKNQRIWVGQEDAGGVIVEFVPQD